MAAPHATHRQTRSPSRSQSPLPPAPVNSAPGPRAQALQKGFSGALGATLKKCNYPNFATCFPTAAQYVPDTLDGLHQQFVAKLEAGCQNQFDKILDERGIVPSLNQLDRLIEEAQRRKAAAESGASTAAPPAVMHALPPETLVNAHLQPFLLEQQRGLATSLVTLQAGNAALLDTVRAQDAELEAWVRGLEAVVADLERSAAAVQADGLQALTGDIRAMEQELGA